MKILGISAFYHDSAAAILQDGKILYAAQEERFTRIKNDASFPENSIKYCLDESGFDIESLDAIAFYDKPYLKFERLLETYYAFAPKGFRSFTMALPVWLKEKLFIKQIIRKKIMALTGAKAIQTKILFPEHHLSHAASAFYTSPFNRCAYLTVDGVGEWATASYGVAGESGIRVLGELHFPDSLGLFYSAFTYFLGFEVNSGEYKMMGLAPYGNHISKAVEHFIQVIKEQLVDIRPDGSIKLNSDYFEYPVGLQMLNPKKWEKLFGLKHRLSDERLDQVHADLALAVQKVTEEILVKLIHFIKRETSERYLCLSGGVALNCVANSVLFNQKVFDDIYVQPAAGDAGGALGAALSTFFINSKIQFSGLQKSFDVYLGPRYSNLEIEKLLRKHQLKYQYFENTNDLLATTSRLLAEKKVIGWFRGRAEFGPRALGHRSILADATDPEMQSNLNMKIKFRESFRPFAPIVCTEDYHEYFEPGKQSYYMLFTNRVRKTICKSLPDDFANYTLEEKRNYVKSDLPAITHVDFSARVQVVTKDMDAVLWDLLQLHKRHTGIGVLINTSFNVKDEPIVNTPEEAYLCFEKTGMDVLVLENYLIEK